MDKHLKPSISIEEFAAYLDCNLSPNETKMISSMIEHDDIMRNIMEASELADESLVDYSDEELALPDELSSVDFYIPFDEINNRYDEAHKFNDHADNSPSTIENETSNNDSHHLEGSNNMKDGTDSKLPLLNLTETSLHGNFETNTIHQVIDNDKENPLHNIETSHNISLNSLVMEQFDNKGNENLSAEIAARKIFGDESFGPNGGFDPVIYQGSEGVCAIRSQQIILRDYGIDISLEELKEFAIQNNWYDPNPDGGTPLWAIGNLLLSCNVQCTQSDGNTVYDLVNELAQGHRIIVGVDANELWADREHKTLEGVKEWFKDCFSGETPNHALVVAGVDVNPDNPNDVKVILTDPGTGDLRIEYKLDDFMDAWEDSNCFMVSTNTPAPFQYDPETGREIPSNFMVDNYIDANSIPLRPENAILPGQMAAMCANPYYSEGHLNTIPVDGENIKFDEYTVAVEQAQKYKSAIGGPNLPGQDHFDKEKFVSSLKSLLGIGGDEIQEDDQRQKNDDDDNNNEDVETGVTGDHVSGGGDSVTGNSDTIDDEQSEDTIGDDE